MTEKEKASVDALAEGNITQAKSYRQHLGKASEKLKDRVGRLLLCLASDHSEPDGWRVFERLLRRYVGGAR